MFKGKLIVLLVLLLLGVWACEKAEEILEFDEKPKEIIPAKTCPTLFDRIMDLLPELQDNRLANPALFHDTTQTRILITRETEVFVSFVFEGAGNANSFGWYAYESGKRPSRASDLRLNILFPNVSNTIIQPGDMLQLGTGKFKPGTVIGFFLIEDGWNNGTINFNNTKHYTDRVFNIGESQQHVLFREKECGDIVLAFEDVSVMFDSDRDFNDIIFTVSDNKEELETVSFALNRIFNF
ncbi:MAG: DUF4114 domain-containing protein [Cyclobacteriaceae bacterium]|nr:DUF4114 domain-containing protein [Cyclobacteriaceae bacterium]